MAVSGWLEGGVRLVFSNPVNIPVRLEYVVTNPFDVSHFRWWMERFGESVREVFYDAGVHTVFKDTRRLDYPPGYLARYLGGLFEVARIVSRYAPGARLWYVIPDVPADYPGREDLYPRNVEKTIEYIEMFRRRYVGKLPGDPVAVVQGGLNKPDSVVKTYISHKELFDEFPLIALGNVCHSRRASLVARELLLFDRVAERPYHAFGVHSNALSWLARRGGGLCLLRSIDSTSYWWDIHYRHGRGKTREEMARIAEMRLRRIKELLNTIPCKKEASITAWVRPPSKKQATR